jgi:hypothetical protein
MTHKAEPADVASKWMADNLTEASSSGDLSLRTKANNLLGSTGLQDNILLGTSAVEIKVGADRLANRKLVTVFPLDNTIYWGFTSAVTVNTGTPIFKNQLAEFEASDVTQIWVISSVANNIRVTEST